jgi:hypothetical protein
VSLNFECCYVECRFAECYYADCHDAECCNPVCHVASERDRTIELKVEESRNKTKMKISKFGAHLKTVTAGQRGTA